MTVNMLTTFLFKILLRNGRQAEVLRNPVDDSKLRHKIG